MVSTPTGRRAEGFGDGAETTGGLGGRRKHGARALFFLRGLRCGNHGGRVVWAMSERAGASGASTVPAASRRYADAYCRDGGAHPRSTAGTLGATPALPALRGESFPRPRLARRGASQL